MDNERKEIDQKAEYFWNAMEARPRFLKFRNVSIRAREI